MNQKWYPWFKARSVLWEAVVRDARLETSVTKSLAQLDLAYLEQTKQDLTIRQLSNRWGWGRSTVHRLMTAYRGGTGTGQERDTGGTDKAAPSPGPVEKVGQERDVGVTEMEHPLPIKRKEKKRRSNTSTKKESVRQANATSRQAKNEAIRMWHEEYTSVYGEPYEMEGRDRYRTITDTLAEKHEAGVDKLREVMRRFLTSKKKGLGWNPPGEPTLGQFVNYYASYTKDRGAGPSARGEYTTPDDVNKSKRKGKAWD